MGEHTSGGVEHGAVAARAATLAFAVGTTGLLYSLAFVVIPRISDLGGGLAAALLLVGGVLGIALFVALYERLRSVDHGLALLTLLLGTGGGLGSAVHGGFDLANAIHDPGRGLGDLPNPVDPRGLLTFGFAGLALLLLSMLLRRSAGFPLRLAQLGGLAGVLLVLVYLARLVILDAGNPLVLVTAALAGFVVVPAFYFWLGRSLRDAPG